MTLLPREEDDEVACDTTDDTVVSGSRDHALGNDEGHT